MSILSSVAPYRAACIQINSQNNITHNIQATEHWIQLAHQQGAVFITLPENVAYMGQYSDDIFSNSFYESEHPALQAFCKLAASLGVWLLVGSLPIRIRLHKKLANRSFLISSRGTIAMRYTKIHLYDASVSQGESHRESQFFFPGKKAKLISTPIGTIGMTICYDLRFPHLYRHLAQQGAELITVPSAFTAYTGAAHWHTLLRARAIETASYILAPAQTGIHPSGRKTYGHSLIVDPWGTILSDGENAEGIVLADIDLSLVQRIRKQLPSLQLQRSFT